MGDKSAYHSLTVGYNKFYIDKRYSNLKPCGDGSYGFVASATDNITGEKVAIKKIKDAFSDSIDAKRILREMKLLRHFNSHENIISIFDIMTVPPNTQLFNDIYIVTNLMESDLERIIRSRQVLTDQHFQYFLYQILRSLKYVHSANVLHRDLKPSNILVNANCDLAVCDFGLARGFHIEGQDTLTEYVVTRWYRAPELLCESPHYGKGVDIWSVGCIFAELLIHDAFFRGENPQHQLEVIVMKIGCPPPEKMVFINSTAAMNSILQYRDKQPKPFSSYFPSGTSPLALDLISKMLQFHPDDRISVEHALEHPYLAEYHIQMPEPNCKTLFNFEFEKVDYDLSSAEVQHLMYEEMLLYRPTATQYPPYVRNQNAHPDTSNTMELADSRTSTSSVCSESSVGSQETCKQGTVNQQSNKKNKTKSSKIRENKDDNTEIDGFRKEGGSGIFTGEGLGSAQFHPYGVVSKEALDSLNSLTDKRNSAGGVSTGTGASTGVHMMSSGYDRINNYRNSYPGSVQDTPPRGEFDRDRARERERERERELMIRSSYENELRGLTGLSEMEINRSYSIPLSGGLGYQQHTQTHTHALPQTHPSAFDHTLRRSQDTVHTGISDINRSLHDSVHSIHSGHVHGHVHGHGHSGDLRGGIDNNCNNNDNDNDASSEKCESMSLDFGHNMESMSIDDGLYDDESKSSVPASPSSYHAKNIFNHNKDFK